MCIDIKEGSSSANQGQFNTITELYKGLRQYNDAGFNKADVHLVNQCKSDDNSGFVVSYKERIEYT